MSEILVRVSREPIKIFTKVLILFVLLAFPLCAQNMRGFEEYFQSAEDIEQWIGTLKKQKNKSHPRPPKLPRNFRWSGRYLVPDLGVDVPFTWHGNNGNIQMIAGSKDDPIYFTNIIFEGNLYTYTYIWPELQPEFLPPLESCNPIKFSLDDLNALFATSFFVGSEILIEKKRRHVHHFRLSLALPPLPPGFQLRAPILSADIYVDQNDQKKFWKVLHFGFQNLYDPNMDEWIVIHKMEDRPGKIKLPRACLSCPQ